MIMIFFIMRFVQQQHVTKLGTFDVRYDRFTTEFLLYHNNQPAYRCWLGLWPFRRVSLNLNQQVYHLNIRWLILWRARLIGPAGIHIKELLSARRRQSYIFAAYTLLLMVFKVSVSLWGSV
ncbi:hypothetical protein IT774_15365 [Salinimonas marina]|uniref:Uncharacterized protein n=1 Tax=Salinimonas marina TaxID=2785918 RepID=A0A7S9DX05_9ALTE|nr:hypothetical protein [Salinimonas marina]QPG05453.1 hypothetical protein IT774_15365 [Salinimonas marina]